METDILRRLHYAAAIACGVFAALVVHIVLTVFGVGLDAVLRDAAAGTKPQLISALAWWAIGGAGFVGGWATGAYLIAAARERDFVYQLARRFLIAVVFAAATAGGVMSKSGNLGGTVDVIAGLTALGLGISLRLLRRAARLSQRRAGVTLLPAAPRLTRNYTSAFRLKLPIANRTSGNRETSTWPSLKPKNCRRGVCSRACASASCIG